MASDVAAVELAFETVYLECFANICGQSIEIPP
jgi:hypothetical protein